MTDTKNEPVTPQGLIDALHDVLDSKSDDFTHDTKKALSYDGEYPCIFGEAFKLLGINADGWIGTIDSLIARKPEFKSELFTLTMKNNLRRVQTMYDGYRTFGDIRNVMLARGMMRSKKPTKLQPGDRVSLGEAKGVVLSRALGSILVQFDRGESKNLFPNDFATKYFTVIERTAADAVNDAPIGSLLYITEEESMRGGYSILKIAANKYVYSRNGSSVGPESYSLLSDLPYEAVTPLYTPGDE